MSRIAKITRKTNETEITLELNLDGSGLYEIHTGVGFFDHMLAGFARHGLFDLNLKVTGDLEVDDHHTIEDTGIVLGQAIREAAGDKKGIRRYGSSILPMDETLVMTACDLCGRPYFAWQGEFSADQMGGMSTAMVREFFYAVSYSAEMNLHMRILDGCNDHHKAEALFKSFAKTLDMATSKDPRIEDVLSTKGSL
ncbi:MAG: imidazoleglycerol-phosphate dehydratase HisB [Eubacterium sp.]|nr:imidazoleglycerol-phosphate dehydratase HisB [Eubacterium sp.]